MKTITLFLLLISPCVLAQPKMGDLVPNLHFGPILNAPTKTATLNQFKDKLVLIEFWATWCGPCLEAMPHLNELQQRHAHQLQVITVTDETPERIGRFLTKRPSKLWFAIDSTRALTKTFPHHIIPHTILIDPDGRLIAQTNPGAITSKVIDSLWRQQPVHLPEKVDNSLTLPEILKAYFDAADTVKSRFIIQAQIKGAPGVQMTHANDPIFKNRRITCLNLPLTTLYRIAYGDFPYKRTIDKTGSTDKSPVYCVDLIVASKDQLMPSLQQELASRFDMQTKIEPQVKEVNVLRITDREKFTQIPRNKSGKRTYSASRGAIDQQATTMADFAEYLESYSPGKLIVVDETQNRELLDIKFSYQPEDPKSLPAVLSEMGLSLTTERRTIDMLVLFNN